MENETNENGTGRRVVYFQMSNGWISGIYTGEVVTAATVHKTKKAAKAAATELAKENGLECEEA